MQKLSIALAAAALAITAPAAAATNLVTNGSFESGFAGWSLSNLGGGTAPVVIAYGTSAGYPTGAFGEAIGPNSVASISPDAVGRKLAYFSSDTANPDTLSQTIALVAGKTYNLGFDYYAPANGIRNPNDATLRFRINGTQVGSTLTAGSVSGTPGQTWFNFNTTFVAAASGPATLALDFRGLGVTAADFGVDRVYATAAVPETSTWAMMIVGFGAVGSVVRRRRSGTLARAAA